MWATVCGLMFLFSSALSHEEFRARFLEKRNFTCGKYQLKIPDNMMFNGSSHPRPWLTCASETDEIQCGRFELIYDGVRDDIKEIQVSALGNYSYIGKSEKNFTGGSGNPVYMLEKEAANDPRIITGLIHKYDRGGWFGSYLAISLSHTWQTMRLNAWLKSGIEDGDGCTEEKIDDCNKNHWVIQDTENIFGVDDGLKVVCQKEKVVGESWTDVGVCADSGKSCGPGTGQQKQTRECNDGTFDKCTNSEKEQSITCNLEKCPTTAATTGKVKPLTKAPTKAQAPTKAETTQDEDEATTTTSTTTKRTSTKTFPRLNTIMTKTTANVTTGSAETNNKEVSYLVGLILFINVFCQTMH